MNKAIITMISAVMITGLLASGVYAAPITLNNAQLDVVAAGGVEKVDGFVFPVIKTDAVPNSRKGIKLGDSGHYSILGPNLSVPKHGTNTNIDGTVVGKS